MQEMCIVILGESQRWSGLIFDTYADGDHIRGSSHLFRPPNGSVSGKKKQPS